MKEYNVILFDADGTLFDFDATEYEALLHTFKKYGYPYNNEIRSRYLDINKLLWEAYEKGEMTREQVIYSRFAILFKELGIVDDGIAFEDEYQKELGKGHHLIEEALTVVEKLAESFDLYIASNGVTATQYQRLIESGLRPYFKDVFVSEEVGSQKPNLAYFTTCFQRIGNVKQEEVLMIGDSLASDIQGGNNAGIDTCWFNPKGKENPENILMTYEIRHLRELYAILEKGEMQ